MDLLGHNLIDIETLNFSMREFEVKFKSSKILFHYNAINLKSVLPNSNKNFSFKHSTTQNTQNIHQYHKNTLFEVVSEDNFSDLNSDF